MTWFSRHKFCVLVFGIVLTLGQQGCRDAPSASPEPDQNNTASSSAEPLESASIANSAADEAATDKPVEPVDSAEEQPAGGVRNVILVIGDGMGPQQLGLLTAYAHLAPGSTIPNRTTAIERMIERGTIALMRTEPNGALVVDSAAAATQLATGQPAGSEMIGTNYRGESVTTVLEIAKQLGKSTGLVSDTRMTHATPAAFAAHQPHRNMENEIAVDLLENRVDILLSGGLRHWLPTGVNDPSSAAYMAAVQMIGGRFVPSSKRQDNRNLLVEARQDYQLVFDRAALEKVEKGRVLGLFANSEMLDAIDKRAAMKRSDRSEPSLAEMTEKALELLSSNPKGFFLMVEAGQIDWAGHNNDTGTMLHELLQLDDAVQSVIEWAADREDTLVLVTADHETGSFGFSYSGSPQPDPRSLGGDVFQGSIFQPEFNFAAPEVLDKIFAQKKSFFHIFNEFDALEPKLRTPEKLVELVNDAMAFEITLDDAVAILTRERNSQFVAGHKYLGNPTVPRMPDQRAFYVYGENLRLNILGHAIGAQQNVVWGSGTHTNTPVVLVTMGPASATKRFTGMMHSTDVGKAMIEVVRGELSTASRP